MRTGRDTQFGFGEEVTYGTPVAPTRFLEILEEEVQADNERIESEGLRPNRRVQHHWAPNRKGAEGDVELEWMDKGMGLVAKHMLGAIATSQPDAAGAPTVFEHLATVGDLDGKSLTWQFGRPAITGVRHPFTYHGGKVAEWEVSNEVDESLRLTLTGDFEDEDNTTALAVAAYAADYKPLYFTGGEIRVGGVAVFVNEWSASGDNGLKTDRYGIRKTSLKKEQLEGEDLREYELETTGEFEDLVAHERFMNGQEATFSALYEGQTISGMHKFATEFIFPRVRSDGEGPAAGGGEVIEQTTNLKVLQPLDGSSPVSIKIRTTDSQP